MGRRRGVAPDAGGAGGDVFAGEVAAGGFEVVGDFEGSQAVGAGGEGLVAEALAALVAVQLDTRRTGIIHCTLLRVGEGSGCFDCVSPGECLMAGKEEMRVQPMHAGTACSESHVPCPAPGES